MMESIRKWFYRPKVNTSRALLRLLVICSVSPYIPPSSVPPTRYPRLRAFLHFVTSFSLFLVLSRLSLRIPRISLPRHFSRQAVSISSSTCIFLKFTPRCASASFTTIEQILLFSLSFASRPVSCRSNACALFPLSFPPARQTSRALLPPVSRKFRTAHVHIRPRTRTHTYAPALRTHARTHVANSRSSRNRFTRGGPVGPYWKASKYPMGFSQ